MAYKVGRCLLRYRLKEAGMTQVDLAAKMNVKPQQINKYVTNERIMSLQTAYNIASILHCQINGKFFTNLY